MTSVRTNNAREAAALPVGASMNKVEETINTSLVEAGELLANIGKARLDRAARMPLSVGMAASEQIIQAAGALTAAYRHSVEAHRHLSDDKQMLGLKVVSWGDFTDTFTSLDAHRIAMDAPGEPSEQSLRVVA